MMAGGEGEVRECHDLTVAVEEAAMWEALQVVACCFVVCWCRD